MVFVKFYADVRCRGHRGVWQGLGVGPCLTPTEQNCEDVGPVETHLSICIYVGPPDILLEAEALCGDPSTP